MANAARLIGDMPETRQPRTTIVVGNPKGGSRTSEVATRTAMAILRHAGVPEEARTVEVVELCELTSGLFAWGDPSVKQAKETVLASDLLVVASPVYKASYTGLLKAFLDHFGRDELRALATVPLMVGASALHSLAVESQLRPVLVEIGAACPTRCLYVLESTIEPDGAKAEAQLADWLDVWGGVLAPLVRARLDKTEEAR